MPLLKPRFRSHLEFRAVGDDVVFVKREGHLHALGGSLYPLLMPHIDGRNTPEDIARLIGERVTVLDVQFGLEELAQAGYFADGAAEEFGIDGPARESTMAAIHSLSAVDSAPLVPVLKEIGLEIGESGESSLDILIVDDYLDARIDAYAAAARDANRPLLLAKPAGTTIWLGPFFQPPRTPCWQCLAARLQERPAFRVQQELEKRGIHFEAATGPSLPSTLHLAWNLIATELWKWAGGQTALDDVILTLDLHSLELKKHIVTRRDNCAFCGDRVTNRDDPPVPIRLESRRKLFTADGGHRAANPETVYERVAHHISPITGIVSDVKPAVADSSATIQVYWATHNHGFRSREDPVHWLAPQRSGGKGMTPAQARTGAVCEAMERYSAIFRGDEIRRTASFSELGDSAIHPNQCMLFSRTQYDSRDRSNRDALPADFVPMPFDESRPVEWSALWSLTHQTFRYLPTAMCYFGYPESHELYSVDSNGLAAGSNLEEAVLQGYLELIERDSVAVWWYNRMSRPAVDLASFRQPFFERLSDYYLRESRDLWALDLTGPFPVPVIVAVSARRPPLAADFLMGFGCHLDPEIAVARALTEMNQLLPVTWGNKTRRMAGDDNTFLMPGAGPARRLEDFPHYRSDDLRQDVEYLTGLATARGLETLVLRQTRPSIGLEVARVVVPGLRPFYARFAPGRLYDVPVEIGWLETARTEAQMNPWPLVC
jgi:oxazoline/thiazoline synthase